MLKVGLNHTLSLCGPRDCASTLKNYRDVVTCGGNYGRHVCGHVKTWAYQINQQLQAVVCRIDESPLPIVGKQDVYTANFQFAHGARFWAEMQERR